MPIRGKPTIMATAAWPAFHPDSQPGKLGPPCLPVAQAFPGFTHVLAVPLITCPVQVPPQVAHHRRRAAAYLPRAGPHGGATPP